MVALIPKGGGGDFRGVGLVDIFWKTVTSLPNHRFTPEIFFCDVLHRFWAGLRTGTTALEVNLLP